MQAVRVARVRDAPGLAAVLADDELVEVARGLEPVCALT
jgi:hypothetical protein